MSKRINLQDKISNGSIILSGREKGETLREKLNLDQLEQDNDEVVIVVPDSIVSFNSSYFLGLFTPSIKKYKSKEKFLKKYKFECDEYILKDIEDGITEALKKNNLI